MITLSKPHLTLMYLAILAAVLVAGFGDMPR